MKLGSNRKGYIPSKYEKSPFLNIPGQGPQKQHSDFLAANSVSLVEKGRGRDRDRDIDSQSAGAGGQPLTIAGRKREMALQAE